MRWRKLLLAGRCARALIAFCKRNGRAHRYRRRTRSAGDLLGRIPARRRVQPAAAVGIGQDGRRDRPGGRRQPYRPGQCAPGPEPNVPTSETGTRHRTAERVARSIDVPVISVSEDLGLVAVYRNEMKHPLEAIPRLLNRANQALQTLERYKTRLDGVSGNLSALEVEDLVTVRDVVSVLQRAEMVRRIAEEVDGYIVELGSDGRLVLLQLEELMGGVEDDRRLVLKDYLQEIPRWDLDVAMHALGELSTDELVDLKIVSDVLKMPDDAIELDASVQPRGYRLLSKIPRLPDSVTATPH